MAQAEKPYALWTLALVAFALLVIWKAPSWVVVLVSAAGGAVIFGR